MTTPLFEIEDLRVSPAEGGEPILNGVSLAIRPGEVHAIMGPNGSGKSTLAQSLLGSPEYRVSGGKVLLHGDDITDWDVDVRGAKSLAATLQEHRAAADLFKVLATLRTDADVGRVDEWKWAGPRAELQAWAERLGARRLYERAAELATKRA